MKGHKQHSLIFMGLWETSFWQWGYSPSSLRPILLCSHKLIMFTLALKCCLHHILYTSSFYDINAFLRICQTCLLLFRHYLVTCNQTISFLHNIKLCSGSCYSHQCRHRQEWYCFVSCYRTRLILHVFHTNNWRETIVAICAIIFVRI